MFVHVSSSAELVVSRGRREFGFALGFGFEMAESAADGVDHFGYMS
jgi:hypothetical protein